MLCSLSSRLAYNDDGKTTGSDFVRQRQSPSLPTEITAADIERIRQARQLRFKYLDAVLFADPAWDMLLDLYRAYLAQHRISTTSVCFGSGCPVTTALRWLNALEERGYVERSQDRLDARRYFVALTPKGIASMSSYFEAAHAL